MQFDIHPDPGTQGEYSGGVSLDKAPEKSNVLGAYRESGVASAAAAYDSRSSERHAGSSAAFFDVDTQSCAEPPCSTLLRVSPN